MSKTLLLISIGPVQEFIASARKLRDLWFGSFILSELSKTVARYLHENGAELIFPSQQNVADLNENSSFNVANKIIAEVASVDDAERLHKRAKEIWQQKIEVIGRQTIEFITTNYKKEEIDIDGDRFVKECSDYGEFYAVWVDFATPDSYTYAWKRVHELLAARKSARFFTAPGWEGAGLRKNSLDGMRETVFTAREIKGITAILKKNERLDAMGCIKRFYPFIAKKESKYFDDLADIALVPWLDGIIQPVNIRNLTAFQDTVLDCKDKYKLQRSSKRPLSNNSAIKQPILSELYFNIKKDVEEMVGAANIEKVYKAREKLFKEYREPSKYAMVLHGDGDKMGDLINALTSADGHRKVAERLSDFAKEVEKIVNQHEGSLIYAGGDDVMAILPLHTGIKCANQLRTTFSELLGGLIKELELEDIPDVPTFSAGIAIVHYLEPLDHAIGLARRAEKKAKDNGRNSLAIIQSKRSGPEVVICGKWLNEKDLPGIADRFTAIVELYNSTDSILPMRLGYQLREIAETAGDIISFTVVDGKNNPTNAAAAMVKRIIMHKNDGDIKKEKDLMPLLQGHTSVRALADELVIGRQIADAELMAEGKVRQ